MSYLDDYQIEFNGLTIGDGTDYDINVEEGLESWDVRTSDVDFPNQWGSLLGEDEVNARTIRFDVEMLNEDPDIPSTFEAAFLPTDGDDFVPLVAKFPGRTDITLDVRCRSRSRRRQVDETLGKVAITVELIAPDPRAYDYVESTESLDPYSTGSEALNLTAGSGADLALDLTDGSGADLAFNFTGTPGGGDVIITNDGNVDVYPEFLFTPTTGDLDAVRVTNFTTDETIEITTTVTVGQTLTADMAMVATPKQGLPISLGPDGVGRYGAWELPRTPLRLAPGQNLIRFEVVDGASTGATCAATWRAAWL